MGDTTVGGLIRALQQFDVSCPLGVYDEDTMVAYSVHSVKEDETGKVVIYT
jgi:hypothetical protein